MCSRGALSCQGRGFAFMKAFIFEHPLNQLTEKYFKHLKTKNFTNEGCLPARVNLVTQVAEAANFPAGQKSLELGHKPTKKSLFCSALKGASQHLNKVIRESKYGKTKSIHSYFLFLRGSAWITTCIFFETIYLILVRLQEVAGGKKCCFKR